MAGIDKTYVSTWEDFKSIRDWAKSVGTVIDDYGNKLTPYNWLYYPDLTEEEFYKNQQECWKEAKERYTKYKDSDVEWEKESYNDMIKDYGEGFLERPELFYEVVIWNTGHIEDIYLIRYCPLEVIQNCLKQQYGDGWSKTALIPNIGDRSYDSIKNRTSEYDTYKREYRKNIHFTIKNLKTYCEFKDDDIVWWVQPYKCYEWNYDENADKWYNDLECYYSTSDWITNTANLYGPLSKRKLARIIQKWNLPAGVQLRFAGGWKRKTVAEFIVTIK